MCEECGGESKVNKFNVACRIASMALAVASVVLMATASQCTYRQNGALAHTVTYSDWSFVYLVVANAIAACLEAIATFLSIWKKGTDTISKVLLPFLDAAVPPLLYSSTGAAFAADMTCCSAYGRVSVCANGTGNFCSQVHVSMYIALAAAVTVSTAEVAKNLSPSDSDSEFGHKH